MSSRPPGARNSMSIIIHREAAAFDNEQTCTVVAVVEPATLRKLRKRLQPFPGLTVVVSPASIWGSERQASYRGVRVVLQRPVSRLEIACQEWDLHAIVRAIQHACASEQTVQQGHGFGAIAAQPLGSM